ncbi:MAG: peptide deformylase [Planctomycetaceae bacterium]|nr:peptide deformylase [Planctomycetaceae bacterium]
MEIVHYPHPVLRFKSGDVTRIDDRFQAAVREMFELMYAANGIGLAANQVGLPLRFFIMNPSGDPDIPEEEFVLINPVIKNRKGNVIGEEGCLSLPGLYGDVRRAEEIVVEAFDLSGQGIRATLTELPARVVQHEFDHIDGTLFIDRISEQQLRELDAKLAPFVDNFNSQRSAGEIPPDAELEQRLKAIAASGEIPDR